MFKVWDETLRQADIALCDAMSAYSAAIWLDAPIEIQALAAQGMFEAEKHVERCVRMREWARRCDAYEGGE